MTRAHWYPEVRLTPETVADHPGFDQALSRLRSGILLDAAASSPIVENRAYTMCYRHDDDAFPDREEPGDFLVRATKPAEAEARARAFIAARWPDLPRIEFSLRPRHQIRYARTLVGFDLADWLWFPQPEPSFPDALEELLIG